VAGLADGDGRLAAQLGSKGGQRLVVDPGRTGEQSRISGEIVLGPHVEQERCAWGPDDTGKLVG
jgi:hypothetical protein